MSHARLSEWLVDVSLDRAHGRRDFQNSAHGSILEFMGTNWSIDPIFDPPATDIVRKDSSWETLASHGAMRWPACARCSGPNFKIIRDIAINALGIPVRPDLCSLMLRQSLSFAHACRGGKRGGDGKQSRVYRICP